MSMYSMKTNNDTFDFFSFISQIIELLVLISTLKILNFFSINKIYGYDHMLFILSHNQV